MAEANILNAEVRALAALRKLGANAELLNFVNCARASWIPCILT